MLRQQVLERLVLQELQMQRAERLGIKMPDEAVNQALTEVAAAQQHQVQPTCPRRSRRRASTTATTATRCAAK